MGAKLQALFDLQDIESQIVDIRRQLNRKERRVNAQTRKLKAAQELHETEQASIREAQVEFDKLDVDVKGRTTNIDRLREHLNTVRTNKEYAAVLGQLNNEKADATRLESKALEMMQAIEARKGELSKHADAVRAEEERLAEIKAELEQSEHSFSSRLAHLEKQRDLASESIGPETLTLFGRLSERYDGEVLAEVEQPNPRRDEFICGGCHMSLRIELINQLQSHNQIVSCKSCGRILYLNR